MTTIWTDNEEGVQSDYEELQDNTGEVIQDNTGSPLIVHSGNFYDNGTEWEENNS